MRLTDTQVNALLAPIFKGRVSKNQQGFSHLEAWDVRRMLNRVFGFTGWSLVETSPPVCVVEQPHQLANGKPGVKVAYRAHLELIIHTPDGDCRYAGSAVAEANQPDYNVGDAHDQALKSAESGALKRAATNLGDQFGLSLYNGSLDPVVQRVLVGGDSSDRPVDDTVRPVDSDPLPSPGDGAATGSRQVAAPESQPTLEDADG